MRRGFAHLLLIIIIVLVIAAAGGYFYLRITGQPDIWTVPANPIQEVAEKIVGDRLPSHKSFTQVSEPKLLFTGGYADPTLSMLPDGTRIMYLNNFSVQPSTYEAHTSDDGITWTKTAAKLPNTSTGRAVKFGDQTRLYYPDLTPIRPTDPPASILSAISSDGINFITESGTRVDPLDGHYLEGPTVFQAPDGSYRMYFSENETASAEKRMSKIWGASSIDGLVWTRDGEATIDPTDAKPWPQALHPFVLTRPDGTFLMLYNTHSELYATESKDGITWSKPGAIGIHGADVDGYYLPDGSIRLYYGDFSEETSGVVYTVDVVEN